MHETSAGPRKVGLIGPPVWFNFCVSELQSLLGLSQSALSQHLAVLRREKIVSARKDAQSVFYSLAGDEATKVMETLHDLFCGARAGKD